MKKGSIISFLTAFLIAAASLPIASFAAESGALMGDIDGDGHITGHDTALLSRKLYFDDIQLTEEQMLLGDVNNDGQTNFDDLTPLHEMEEVAIGGFDSLYSPEEKFDEYLNISASRFSNATMFSALVALVIDSNRAINREIVVCSEEEFSKMDSEHYDGSLCITGNKLYVSDVVYNVLDGNADGVVDIIDCYDILRSNSLHAIIMYPYPQENRYDIAFELDDPKVLDTDVRSGILLAKDYVEYCRLTNDPEFTLTEEEYALSIGYIKEEIDGGIYYTAPENQ